MSASSTAPERSHIVEVDVRFHVGHARRLLQVVGIIARIHHECGSVFCVRVLDVRGASSALVKRFTVHALNLESVQVAAHLLGQDSQVRSVALQELFAGLSCVSVRVIQDRGHKLNPK